MLSLLEIKDLCTWFPIKRGVLARTVNYVRAVDGVSLSIGRREIVGLVGESGCGKSTLARTVMRLEPARAGEVIFDGVNLLGLSDRQMRPWRRKLQIVFQDPFASLNPRMTVRDIITEAMVEHGLIRRAERTEIARGMLDQVGLGSDALGRYPHEFSGGQRQRISIARAIAMKPALVLCDEAVSALDVSVQAQVINLLLDLHERFDLSYLFISHDLSVVRHIAQRTVVMYLGKIVEEGPTEKIMAKPGHPYTRALISAVPRLGVVNQQRIVLSGDVPSPVHPPSGCRFHPRCPHMQPRCRVEEPMLQGCGENSRHRVACWYPQ